MLINADFSQPASLKPEQHQWVASPQGGVKRMMLDRIGAEKARATKFGTLCSSILFSAS